jgi:hypothetical protein
MSGFSGLDLDAFAEATVPARLAIAAEIAAEVETHYSTVEVHADGSTVSVTTHGSFDHLKEWGSINNRPKGYMRSAAAAQGTYRPEGK